MLAADREMLAALDQMLRSNEKITARAVVRNVAALGAASSITRDTVRNGYLVDYQTRQAAIQKHQKGLEKEVRGHAAQLLAQKDAEIARLEHRISLLTASHIAMVRAAGEIGGTVAWKRLFEGYSGFVEELTKIGAFPEADIRRIPSNRKPRGTHKP